jgi:hypothetical protein
VEEFSPLPEEKARAYREVIARWIRGGECRERIRADLIGAGLPPVTADQLLAGVKVPILRPIGSAVAAALALMALATLPLAGAVAGFSIAWSPLTGEACGMWVFPALFVAGCGGLLGLAAGLGLALGVLWGLSALYAGASRDA